MKMIIKLLKNFKKKTFITEMRFLYKMRLNASIKRD